MQGNMPDTWATATEYPQRDLHFVPRAAAALDEEGWLQWASGLAETRTRAFLQTAGQSANGELVNTGQGLVPTAATLAHIEGVLEAVLLATLLRGLTRQVKVYPFQRRLKREEAKTSGPHMGAGAA